VPLLSETNRRKRNLLVILGFLVLVGGLSAFDLGSFAPELPVACCCSATSSSSASSDGRK